MASLEFSDTRSDAHGDGAAAETFPAHPSDHEAAALVQPDQSAGEMPGERSGGDLAARPSSDAQAEPYGRHDPDASADTPHLDAAKELVGSGEKYHAFGNLGHDAKVAGAAALAGGLLFAVISSSGGPSVSAQERDTTQIAAAAEHSTGDTSVQAAVQDLNIERIPPAADPKDEGAVAKDIQDAEAEGAANMHGGSSGVTPREYAVEALAADKLSGVAVPAEAKQAMTAGMLDEEAGTDAGPEFMEAADSALAAADNASNDGATIKVPLSEKNS